MKSRYIVFFLMPLFLWACANSESHKEKAIKRSKQDAFVVKTGFQKINFADTNYSAYLSSTASDIITKSGYKIEYRVVDSTKYKDLYILWSKGNFKDTFCFHDVLLLQDYEFIPVYESETEGYIFMYYDCAQMGCGANILLNKDSKRTTKHFISLYQNVREHSFLLYGFHSIDFPSNEMNLFNYAMDDTVKIDLNEEVFYDSCKVENKRLFLYLHKSDDDYKVLKKIVKRIKL